MLKRIVATLSSVNFTTPLQSVSWDNSYLLLCNKEQGTDFAIFSIWTVFQSEVVGKSSRWIAILRYPFPCLRASKYKYSDVSLCKRFNDYNHIPNGY